MKPFEPFVQNTSSFSSFLRIRHKTLWNLTHLFIDCGNRFSVFIAYISYFRIQILACGGKLVATLDKRYIASPNYPQNYPIHENCRWEITGEREDLSITLDFITFDLEGHSSCIYDYVQAVNGGSLSPLTPKLCGQHFDLPIVQSIGSKIIVEFESDYSTTRPGFNASFYLSTPRWFFISHNFLNFLSYIFHFLYDLIRDLIRDLILCFFCSLCVIYFNMPTCSHEYRVLGKRNGIS